MTTNPSPDLLDVYAALWMGALMLASGAIQDPFPAELEDAAARYFELFPPVAKG
jgi:hypothetical protein